MCSRTAYQMIQTGRTRSHSRATVSALANGATPAEPFRRQTWNYFGCLRRRFDGSAQLRRQATVPLLKAAAKRIDLYLEFLLQGVSLCDPMDEHRFPGRLQIRPAARPQPPEPQPGESRRRDGQPGSQQSHCAHPSTPRPVITHCRGPEQDE